MGSYQFDLYGRRWASAAVLALAFAIVFAAVAFSEGAEALPEGNQFEVDDIKYQMTDEGSHLVEIIGYENNPAQVGGTVSYEGSDWTVASVGESAFQNCRSLSEISLPSAISIGSDAFNSCYNLSEISMPNAVSVGANAFQNCWGLSEISLSNVEFVGDYAFQSCNNLRNVSLPAAVSVGDYAFQNCFDLEEISLPNVESVGDYAFQSCFGLEEISLPNVESVGDYAFDYCAGLSTVRLPAMTYMGDYVFQNCFGLREVSLPAAINVGGTAFKGCAELREVSLPAAVSVGDYAFQNCLVLSHISFFEGLKEVGDDVFSVRFYSGNEKIDPDAGNLSGREFVGPGIGSLYEGFAEGSLLYTVLSEDKVSVVGFAGNPDSLSVPSSVEHGGTTYIPVSIGEQAFAKCDTLKSVSIGDAVVSIGYRALYCSNLVSIEVSDGNTAYESEAGVLYDHGKKTLLKFPASKQRLNIPESVKEIAPGAFQDVGVVLKRQYSGGDPTYFRYVKIPASVEKIGAEAFRGSTLECLKFSGGDVSIGDYAFDLCSALNYVVFSATFESVGEGAFGCTFYDEKGGKMPLDEAMAGHKFTKIGDRLELYVPKLNGTIVDGDVKYRITANGESKAVTAICLADEDAAELAIPASVSYLGFEWTVTGIAFKAFDGCQSLESVTIGGAVSIGSYAFFDCKNLRAVVLSDDSVLGTSAFSGCRSLAEINLENVVSVGKHAFYGCKSLIYADLSSAESIGYGAFTGTDLRDAVFGCDLYEVNSKAFYGYTFKDAEGSKIKATVENLSGNSFSGQGKALVMEA